MYCTCTVNSKRMRNSFVDLITNIHSSSIKSAARDNSMRLNAEINPKSSDSRSYRFTLSRLTDMRVIDGGVSCSRCIICARCATQ